MAHAGFGGWDGHASVAKYFAIDSRSRALGFGPLLQILQFHAQDRTLNPLHAIVVALERVMVAILHAPVTEQANLACVFRIVRRDQSAFACRAKVLSRIKAKRRHVADGTGPPTLVFGSVG